MAATWLGRPLRAVLWDLDGTLLDTAQDIALALNRALAELALPRVPSAEVRRMIGRGSPVLIERALELNQVTAPEATRTALLQRFFDHYGLLQDQGESTAHPYSGAEHALRRLRAAGLGLACVTNKQRLLAERSLAHGGLLPLLDLIVGGDTCSRRKPAPEPLWHACQRLGVPVEASLMVGDSINDVLAARAAGMPVVCVPYGYNEGNDPSSLECDAHIQTLAELPGLLGLDVAEATPDAARA